MSLREVLDQDLLHHKNSLGREYYSIKESVLIKAAQDRGVTLIELMIECLGEGIWPERFRAQQGTYTADEQANLLKASVAIIGAGGLGGAMCLLLSRIGIGRLVVCDGDVFDESNLNRQLLSNYSRVGLKKADVAVEEIKKINPATEVKAYSVRAAKDNIHEILDGCGVAVDCLDNMKTRYLLEHFAAEICIPYVHGALAGQEGMVLTVFPGEPGLRNLYGPEALPKEQTAESIMGTPTITPAIVAGFQATEVINIILNRPTLARKRLLHLDLSALAIDNIELI